jgi:predicted nucleic acid-binding protein
MNQVLVDTSVWIDFFRDGSSPYGRVVDALLDQEMVCTTPLIKAEIVPSARNKKEFNNLRDYFGALPLLEDPPNLWDDIIHAQFTLKRKGLHGVGIPDLMIAISAKAHDREIFSRDRHFELMQKPLRLKLFKAEV